MLNQKRPAVLHERRAVAAVSPSWIDRWGAQAVFVGALLLCAASFVRYVSHTPATRAVHTRVKAREVVDVFSLHRAPTVAAGAFRYAVLGYGQDAETGVQIVWMRSISTNRVGGFKEGQRLFDGPVKLSSIEDDRVVLSYHGEDYEAPIQP